MPLFKFNAICDDKMMTNFQIIHKQRILLKLNIIFIYNTKILLPSTFDEQTDKKRYASTGNRTHDQDWFT